MNAPKFTKVDFENCVAVTSTKENFKMPENNFKMPENSVAVTSTQIKERKPISEKKRQALALAREKKRLKAEDRKKFLSSLVVEDSDSEVEWVLSKRPKRPAGY